MERIGNLQGNMVWGKGLRIAALVTLAVSLALPTLFAVNTASAARSTHMTFPDGVRASGIYSVDGGFGLTDPAYAELRAALESR